LGCCFLKKKNAEFTWKLINPDGSPTVLWQKILDAHNIWSDREWAGVYNYTQTEILQKARILNEAWFTVEQRRILLWSGICGNEVMFANEIQEWIVQLFWESKTLSNMDICTINLWGCSLDIINVEKFPYRKAKFNTPYVIIDQTLFEQSNGTRWYKWLREGETVTLWRSHLWDRFDYTSTTSRSHVEISLDNNEITVSDLYSTNGTIIDTQEDVINGEVINESNNVPEGKADSVWNFESIAPTLETQNILAKYPQLVPQSLLNIEGMDFYFSPIFNSGGRNMAFAYVNVWWKMETRFFYFSQSWGNRHSCPGVEYGSRFSKWEFAWVSYEKWSVADNRINSYLNSLSKNVDIASLDLDDIFVEAYWNIDRYVNNENKLNAMFMNEVGKTNKDLMKNWEYLRKNNSGENRFSSVDGLNAFWDKVSLPENMQLYSGIYSWPDMMHNSFGLVKTSFMTWILNGKHIKIQIAHVANDPWLCRVENIVHSDSQLTSYGILNNQIHEWVFTAKPVEYASQVPSFINNGKYEWYVDVRPYIQGNPIIESFKWFRQNHVNVVKENASLSPKDRISKAKELIWDITPTQEQAILDAHNQDGTIFNLNYTQLRSRVEILSKAGLDNNQIRILLENGICGQAKINLPIHFYKIKNVDVSSNMNNLSYNKNNKPIQNFDMEWYSIDLFKNNPDILQKYYTEKILPWMREIDILKQKIMQDIVSQVWWEIKNAPLKWIDNPARAIEKVVGEYDGDINKLLDISRWTLVYNNITEVYKAFDVFLQHPDVVSVFVKDNFQRKTWYRDINLAVTTTTWRVFELQINTKNLIESKENGLVISEEYIKKKKEEIEKNPQNNFYWDIVTKIYNKESVFNSLDNDINIIINNKLDQKAKNNNKRHEYVDLPDVSSNINWHKLYELTRELEMVLDVQKNPYKIVPERLNWFTYGQIYSYNQKIANYSNLLYDYAYSISK